MKIIKSGLIYITESTKEEREAIKAELTIDNPQYEVAKKYSKFANTSVKPKLTFYQMIGKTLIVPRGYRIPFKYSIEKDEQVLRHVIYPDIKLQLRGTQLEAYNTWIKDPSKGIIVLPTGKGKSILGVYIASATKQRTLVVVNKDDLVDGWKADIKKALGLRPKQQGLIKGKIFRIGRQITITTIQTLSKLPQETLESLHDTFGLIIVDEQHHSPSSSYEVLDYFKPKYLLGLTATDDHTIKQMLYWRFGGVAFRHEETEDDEDIMPYTVVVRNSNIKYNPPQLYYYYGKTLTEEEVEELVDNNPKAKHFIKRKPLSNQEIHEVLASDKEFNYMVARDILHEASHNKSCIAFLHEKEHVRTLRDILLNLGLRNDHIQLFYGDSKESNQTMKRRAESKEVLVTLATFSKATEGTNVTSWERGFLVTSINNEKGTTQAVGRLRRRKKGKEDVIIYDYRHPTVKGLKSHGDTRDKAYKKAKAKVIGDSKMDRSVKRGFKR